MVSVIFYNLICKEINEIVKPLGFKKYNRFFYRITEDGAVQQFCLLCLNNSFTIRFSLSSVYCDNDRTKEGDEIFQIINGSNKWLGDNTKTTQINGMTVVYAHKDYSYTDATDICIKALQEILLPYFENAKSIHEAHKCILKKLNNNVLDIRNIGFFLAKEEYDEVKNILNHLIDNKDRLNKKWWKEKESEFQELLEAINSQDINFIQKYKENKKALTYSEFKISRT